MSQTNWRGLAVTLAIGLAWPSAQAAQAEAASAPAVQVQAASAPPVVPVQDAASAQQQALPEPPAASMQATPAGLWKTTDESSGKDTSLVRIVEEGGVLTGRIEKILDPDSPPHAVCDRCYDDRKNVPLVGLLLIRNVHHSPKDVAIWDGGDILDPHNGRIYKVRLRPQEAGQKLEVRGYIGAPSFGRSQIWLRVE